MDWQNLFSPQLWGTFAPYLIVNMLLAAAFGWIGGWLSHRWTSKRDKANWERDWKTELLREKRAKLEQIKTEIRETGYVARGYYPVVCQVLCKSWCWLPGIEMCWNFKARVTV